MALTLSIKKGNIFYVGDMAIKVENINGESVILNLGSLRKTIRHNEFTEIMPDVRVSLERVGREEFEVARLVIDAPREIPILRQELYAKLRQVPDSSLITGGA